MSARPPVGAPHATTFAAPIEVSFPDIEPHAPGNTGIPFVWTFRSDRAGPHVVVQALTHGNEVCGAIALDWALREELRPAKGSLSLVFANVAAYRRFDPADPFASRCVDEDFNRLWDADVLDGPRDSAELGRARELRAVYDRADYLLDLHSMSDPCPPLALAGRRRKGLGLACALGAPQHVVIDAGHAAGRRLRDYAFFDDESDPRAALLVECGQHWEAAAPRVGIEAMLRFLKYFGMVEPRLLDACLPAGAPPPQKLIEVTTTVTIHSDRFAFTIPVEALQTISAAGTAYAVDGGTPVRTPHDDCVLIMPTRRPKRGETAVRLGRYVQADF